MRILHSIDGRNLQIKELRFLIELKFRNASGPANEALLRIGVDHMIEDAF